MSKSVLSAGLLIYEVLSEDEALRGKVSKIFPVMTDSATLPYIAYRRTGVEGFPLKGNHTHNRATIEVLVMTESYPQGVELAEQVRALLDNKQITGEDGFRLNSCMLTDASETWSEDAFVQSLVFTVECY